MTPTWQLLVGDVRERLGQIPTASVDLVVTSPPYWGLRDYGTGQWEGGDPACAHAGRVKPRQDTTGSGVEKGRFATTRGLQPGKSAYVVPVKDRCKCGAVRIDRQLGLERTPEEYVAKLVDIFRAVHRVLRDDGSVFLNLGDTYITSTSGRRSIDPLYVDGRARGAARRPNRGTVTGFKHTDLALIPHRVAIALQQPYYGGSIKSEHDRVWLAAMLDAEGCLFICKRKAGTPNGQGNFRINDTYSPGVEISNTSLLTIQRIHEIVGKGSVCSQGPTQNRRRKQVIYRWNLRTNESREFVRELYPYLVAKRQQARILYGSPSSGVRAAAAHEALKSLHRTGQSTVDFPEIPTLLEPGWYVRQDNIWSKNNPMPESVKNRTTRSHEYVFHLTKSAKYYYDAEAVMEATTGNAHPRGAGVGPKTKNQPRQRGVKQNASFQAAVTGLVSRRNRRSVWTFSTKPYKGAHFATFPAPLPRLCIMAATSAYGCCAACGAPYARVLEKGKPRREQQQACGGDANGEYHGTSKKWEGKNEADASRRRYVGFNERWRQKQVVEQNASAVKARILAGMVEKRTIGWRPTCACPPGVVRPPVVLDPFAGTATTGEVALRLGRSFIGIELKEQYAREFARPRLAAAAPRFAREAVS